MNTARNRKWVEHWGETPQQHFRENFSCVRHSSDVLHAPVASKHLTCDFECWKVCFPLPGTFANHSRNLDDHGINGGGRLCVQPRDCLRGGVRGKGGVKRPEPEPETSPEPAPVTPAGNSCSYLNRYDGSTWVTSLLQGEKNSSWWQPSNRALVTNARKVVAS